MNGFIQNGILDDKCNPTIYGKKFIEDYRKSYELVSSWLKSEGVSEKDVENDAYTIIEKCSEDTIQLFKLKGAIYKACDKILVKKASKSFIGDEICRYLEDGEYRVPFIFEKIKSKKGGQFISMANEGFYHPALLTIKDKRSYLCLEIKEIKRKVFSDKMELKGLVNSIKYELNGKEENAIFIEDKILSGKMFLTMTCNVGTIHMPQSTAVLKVRIN